MPSGRGKEIADMLLKFQDSHHVKLALRVLGLMCDGQYRLMQNYLREQKDNLASVNVVSWHQLGDNGSRSPDTADVD